MRKWLLRAAIGVGLFTPLALLAQTVVTTNLVGTEYVLMQSGSVGGAGIIVPGYVLRSGSNHQLVAAGTTINTQILAYNQNVLATGAITTTKANKAPITNNTIGSNKRTINSACSLSLCW